MRVELVCVALAALAVSVPSLSDGAPLQVLSAPNLLRVGSKENVFVEIQDHTGGPVTVTIMVKTYPGKSNELLRTKVDLNQADSFQKLVEILIPEDTYKNGDPREKQYVYLQAQFPDRLLEKVVLLSFQSGYIFIQTDKPLYTPGSTVQYRVFGVAPNLVTLTSDPFIRIEIMTPQNIIIKNELFKLGKGIKTGNIKLPEIVNVGVWKMVCRFDSTPQKTFFAEFEVKEYVLPSFEIQLKPTFQFFYVDDEELTIDIKAKYLFGQDVKGTAIAVFGIDKANGEANRLPGSIVRVPLSEGKAQVTLKRADIPNITALVGHSIYVEVSVQAEGGGDMVRAEKRGIKIVTSPYTIHFKKTSKYFKPGMPFDVKVYVTNPDESPAKSVPLVVTSGNTHTTSLTTGTDGVSSFSLNPLQVSTLQVAVKTNAPDLPDSRQARASMTALAYKTNSKNLLRVKVPENLSLGKNMKVELTFKGNTDKMDVTYLIVSKGQLIKAGRLKRERQADMAENVPVTKDMLPSYRVVAYYHMGAGEVVSDSVWVEINEVSCMGTLKVEKKGAQSSYAPGKPFELTITGDPGATVCLVAVDKAVSVLNSKHRLTQSKVWEDVEKQDTGCTAGSGKDSMGVFYDAGLVFQTSTASGTDIRTAPSCPVSSRRRRRAVTLSEARDSLARKFSEELRTCCVDGMKDNALGYTCERRSEYISDGPPCVQAFLDCCRKIEAKKKELKHSSDLILARSGGEEIEYPDESTIRSKFPESWMFINFNLSPCPPGRKCDPTSVDKLQAMPDSITTWQIFAISMSGNNGICVADPLELMVQKNFFIDLKLPYSAVLNEQLEIKAVVHNYLTYPVTAHVLLWENEHICSVAHKRKHYKRTVDVAPSSTWVVPFVIIPMKLGKLGVMVTTIDSTATVSDAVQRDLLVVPQGERVTKTIVETVDPEGGVNIKYINTGVLRNQVPDTPVETFVNVTAGEQTSALVQSVISGQHMERLIKLPGGCGEQNMAAMTLPVIATSYLDRTSQWESVGMETRDTAIGYIDSGYQGQLGYRKSDGSFSIFDGYPSSTWLTAYVAKVFSMASQLIAVQDSVLCDAINWLSLSAQRPDGAFSELYDVWDRSMIGDVAGEDTDVSMTAFVVIAMQEARPVCKTDRSDSLNKALAFLEKALPTVTNPYAVAMASYALANEGKLNKELLFDFAAQTKDHWPVARGDMYTLEATAYALLALVRAEALEEAGPIVRWLNKQKKDGDGGYGSTQSTIMVYQAVSEYWSNAKNLKEFTLHVDVKMSGRSSSKPFTINRGNQFLSRSVNVKDSNQNITVTASGTGQATVVVSTMYYAELEENNSDCTTFDLDVKLTPVAEDKDKEYDLKIEILYKSQDKDAAMTILDIGLLTGFSVETSDLVKLTEGKDRYIEKFEEDKKLSDRGSLIIYLNKVSHKRPDIIKFRIRRDSKGDLLQPGTVTAYEYYEPKRCRKFYHPERSEGGLTRLCKEEHQRVCDCAEESCSMQKKTGVTDESRLDKACEVTQQSNIDYVYKASVQGISSSPTTDKYTMRIEEVLKEGTDKGVAAQLRTYLGMSFCREALGLKKDKSYLLMGYNTDLHRKTDGTFHYVLGQNTWVEYWPSPSECQRDRKHRNTCLGLEALQDEMSLEEGGGCHTK